MQTTLNFYILISKLPKILLFLSIMYVLIKVFRAFIRDCFIERKGTFWASVFNFFDPYRQSIFCFRYKWVDLLIIVVAVYVLYLLFVPPDYTVGNKGMYVVDNLIYNDITYFINYLVHENLGHNMFCIFGRGWFCSLSGDFMQISVPCIIYLFSLQIRGGLFFSPILFYWISAAIYDAGIYASDAAVSKLALTSSDMVSNYAAGEQKGDWHYILEPFNAINYGATIGLILEIIACFMLALALYSIIEYIRRLGQHGLENYRI